MYPLDAIKIVTGVIWLLFDICHLQTFDETHKYKYCFLEILNPRKE